MKKLMKFAFPVREICELSRNNKKLTYIIFLVSLAMSAIKGSLQNSYDNPNFLHRFFDHWVGTSKSILLPAVNLLYTPIGVLVWLLLIFLLYLWIIYRMAGIKKVEKFTRFVFSFLGLSAFGLILLLIGFALSFVSIRVHILVKLLIYFYWVLFYIQVLIYEYNVKPIRSISSIGASFILLFILGGFPILAPYLQWL